MQKIKTNILLVCNLLLGQMHHHTPSNSTSSSGTGDSAGGTPTSGSGSAGSELVTFQQVLRKSLSIEKTIPTYCDDCKKFSPTNQRARCVDLPNILSVNCGLTNDAELAFLQRQMDGLAGLSAPATAASTAAASTANTGMKPCRYGMNCTRVGCHFTHIDRRSPSAGTSTAATAAATASTGANGGSAIPIVQPTSNAPAETWFPLRFSMEIADDSELHIDVLKVDTSGGEPKKPAAEGDGKSNTVVASGGGGLDDVAELADALPTETPAEATTKSAPNPGESATAGPLKKRTYDLSAVVCQINEGTQPAHLVALVYVGDAYHRIKPEPVRSRGGQWYVFNDFNINPIALDEAPWYTLDWKVPCVLFYTSAESRRESREAAAVEQPPALLVNPFVQDYFTQQSAKKRYDLTFKPLTADEVPKAGDYVAMDAEFVTLNPEENEISSDGKTTTIKPCHMSVARITCIRG